MEAAGFLPTLSAAGKDHAQSDFSAPSRDCLCKCLQRKIKACLPCLQPIFFAHKEKVLSCTCSTVCASGPSLALAVTVQGAATHLLQA